MERSLLFMNVKLLHRSFVKPVIMAAKGIAKPIRRWLYYKSYFPQLGLRRDDCLHEYPEVKEALRRLPKDQYYERQFRISRALQLSLQKQVLPREEWTVYEEDERYLQPYLDDIKAEQRERMRWSKIF